jgi:hypothetical protein
MLERVFLWTCDVCCKLQKKDNYGLPDGWVFIKSIGGPVKHACAECAEHAGGNQRREG